MYYEEYDERTLIPPFHIQIKKSNINYVYNHSRDYLHLIKQYSRIEYLELIKQYSHEIDLLFLFYIYRLYKKDKNKKKGTMQTM